MHLLIVDEVYEDLRSARDWYAEKREGLGYEFVKLFYDTVKKLLESSLYSPIDETGYRPKRMPRFTAVIYYDVKGSDLVVVGLLVNGRSASGLRRRG
jgi:hypothetical protein